MIKYFQIVLYSIKWQQWVCFGVFTSILFILDGLYLRLKPAISKDKKIKWKRKIFLFYTSFILLITLFSREPSLQYRAAMFPFWSWIEVITNHNTVMLYQILLNILLFIPFGALLKLSVPKTSVFAGWLTGLSLSGAIEVCQLLFHLGLFEWDDLLHNSFGCFLGLILVSSIQNYILNNNNSI